jgi:hypothetical protein
MFRRSWPLSCVLSTIFEGNCCTFCYYCLALVVPVCVCVCVCVCVSDKLHASVVYLKAAEDGKSVASDDSDRQFVARKRI